MYTNILIATDGSELSLKGVDQGVALAAALRANVTILTVTQPLRLTDIHAAASAGIPDLVTHYDQQVAAEVEQLFADLTERLRDSGVAVTFEHEVADHPAEAIIAFAERNQCDLIVMSSHGRRGIRRLILGSQTSEVLVHSDIPVLVMR